ncbi:hypothetical protein SteCoe_15607 [Stentor coeruleus]|uniref:ENTH domain-containing protein n=1 Tax=Stentor coeruleus TaxID=5963 RepID=A0A1R2C397_9CILI|nr:hypothetical protein SteCoe_15607 [Stentor coeruleus]
MDSLMKAVSGLKDRIVKSPLERSVLEACSDENWGSANTLLHDIAEKTFNQEERQTIMKTLWELLKSPPKEWRRLYKVLNLIEILMKFGSAPCLHEIQDEAFKIRMLQDFSYREGSEEKGIGVRDKAKYICSMLNDRNYYEEEKEKAKKTRSKFSGMTSNTGYTGKSDSSWRNDSYDPYVSKSYQNESSYTRSEPSREYTRETAYVEKKPSAEVSDIFKVPDVKPVKTGVWQDDQKKAPVVNMSIKPLSSTSGPSVQSIFDVPNVKKVHEPAKTQDLLGDAGFGGFVSAPQNDIFPSSPSKLPSPPAPSFPSVTTFPPVSNPIGGFQSTPLQNEKPSSYTNVLSGIFPNNPSPFSQTTPVNYPGTYIDPKPSGSFPQQNQDFNLLTGLYMPTNSIQNQNIPNPNPIRPAPTNQPMMNSGLKVNYNISNDSGATMSQIKLYGRTDFSDFKAAPETMNKPKDLESKLFNLDDLQAGQPKPKEIVKSRW